MLVQSWLDTGDDNAEPGSFQSLLLPRRQYRVSCQTWANNQINVHRRTSLPKDRESVFWFNVLEVPPKPDAEKVANQSLLQLSRRSRIKLSIAQIE
ncbi:fimbria/pilus periplasmic chaperone [Escherichia coli]